MNYNLSARERIADINRGLVVTTPVMENTTAMPGNADVDLFNVYGRIRILTLDIEAITAWSNDATTLKFTFDPSNPAIAAIDISAASASVAQVPVGKRVRLVGTALNTAVAIDANATVSLQAAAYIEVGCYDGVGAIGVTSAAAAQTSGTSKAMITYVPLTEGAYVESAV
jgi:predicted pyridoxine 5'-phosphate oxidase superfamily flavin-nucleotide-binding protein